MKNSTETQKDHAEVVSEIKKKKGDKTLRAFAREIGVNHGYLSAIINGTRPASNTVRLALGLHPLHVTVAPLACGCPPVGKRCPVHEPAKKYAPHPVMRVSRLRKLLQNQYYKDS